MSGNIQNRIIDIDYFVANQSEIEKVKNKKFSSAVATLLKFQSGNYLLYDGNTQKITNITQNTAVFFNQALVKDIARSYEMLEDACSAVYESDFKEMLCDEPVLFGKKAIFTPHKDGFYIINSETDEFFKDMPSSYFHNEDKLGQFDFRRASYYSRDDMPYNFEISKLSFSKQNRRLGRVGFFTDKADGIITVKNKQDDESRRVLIKHGFSFGKRNTKYAKDAGKTRLDLSFKLDYLEKSTRHLTGLDMDLFAKLTKKAEMFTYGYLTNKDDYISRKTARYIYSSGNPEYDKSARLGRESIDNINKDYQSVLNLLQYSIDTDMDVPTLYEKLSSLSMSSVYIRSSVSSLVENTPVDLDNTTIKQEVAKINIFLNGIVESLNRIDEIDLESLNENYPLKKELGAVNYYSSKKKVIDKSIEIFNNIQSDAVIEHDSDLDIEKVNEIIKSFTVRTRAGVLDTKVDSYVLNMRDGNFDMNESLQELYDEDPVIKVAIDNLKNNKYYDYFEFDKDYMDGTTSGESKNINRAQFLEFTHAINELDMPVDKKSAFKIRKLGNYKASGIYFSGVNTIAVDCRFGNHFSSAKHEEVHRIDISSQLNKYGRHSLVNDLSRYFSPRVEELDNAHYYLKDVELIARAGEIASLLYEGNYEKHLARYNQGSISEEDLWENVKIDFEDSKTKTLMKSFNAYSESSVYIDFQKATQRGSDEEKLIGTILEYYKPFFSKEMTDVLKLQSSYSSGNENRDIEGIKTENFEHISLKSDEEKLITPSEIVLNNFSTFSVDFDTLGTKEITNVVSELKENGVVDSSILQEQLENKVLSLDELTSDKDALYNLVSDTNLKSILFSHINNSSKEYQILKELAVHFIEDEPEKSLSLVRNNPSLQDISYYSSSGTFFGELIDGKGLKNRELLFIEFTKVIKNSYRFEEIMNKIDYKSPYYAEILTNGIVSLATDEPRWRDDNLFLANAIYNDVNFSSEDIDKIKSLSLSFRKFSEMFLGNNYSQDFELAKFSQKLENFLNTADIEYSRNEFIKNVCIDWGVNSKGLVPVGVEDAKNFVADLVYIDRTAIENELRERYPDDKERVSDLLNKRVDMVSATMMRNYIEFIEAMTLENSSNAELYKITSSMIPESFVNSSNAEHLSRVLAINNSYKDFKSVLNWDNDSKLQELVSQSRALYSSFFAPLDKEDSYKNYIDFLSDKKPEEIRGYSDYLFYSSFKEEKHDVCANMLISSATSKENLHAMAGVIIALDNELGVDSLDVLKSSLPYGSHKNSIVVEEIKDRLIAWGNSTVPVEIVKNVLNRPAKEIRELDKAFGSGFSSMAIFSKDVNETELKSYTKKNSEALNDFLEYDTSVSYYLSRQGVVHFSDKDKFCMSIKSVDELKEIRTRINSELNKFKCISPQGLLRAFGSISKTLKDASTVLNPPTMQRLSSENLSAIKGHYDVEGRNLEAIRMSMLHGVINEIEKNYPHESLLLEQLKDLSNKVSYHTICRDGTRDEDITNYHTQKVVKGIETIDGIVSKEQFKDFPIALSPVTYSGITTLTEYLDKIVPVQNESILNSVGNTVEEKSTVSISDVENIKDRLHQEATIKEQETVVNNNESSNTNENNVFSEPALDEYDGAHVGR